MRILIASAVPRDPYQGASGTLCATVDTLRELGHEVHEIWCDALGPRRILHGNLHYLLELPQQYRAAIRRQTRGRDFDVIQVSQPHAWLAARDHQRHQASGVFVNRSHGWEEHVYRVMQPWEGKEGIRKSWWRRAASSGMRQLLQRSEARVVRYSDGLVVGSVDDRDFLLTRYGLPPNKVLAVAPGLAAAFFEAPPISLTPERLRRWLYLGQFTACKGPDVVAGVINRVFPRYPYLEMTWVTQEACHERVREMVLPELRPRLHLSGWLTHAELVGLYDRHGVYVFPSYFEGFAKTFLEAMSRGLCVVATAVDGMRQVIHSGENGFLSAPGDVPGLAAQAVALLENPDLAVRVGTAARTTALSFTWRRSVEELVGFFDSLLRRKRQRATV